MAVSLRLPSDMEADLKDLAKAHNRSMHGEMLHALKQYLQQEKGKQFVANQELVQAVQASIAQAKADGMDTEDVKWMATGAGILHGREQGAIPQDEVSPEMVAAVKAVVERELKK